MHVFFILACVQVSCFQEVVLLLHCVGVTLCSDVQSATRVFPMHLYHLDDVSAAAAMVMLRRVIHRLDTAVYVIMAWPLY